MLDISSIQTISAVVAVIDVIVGVVFTVLELRNLVKTRQTDLVIRLYSTYGSKEIREAVLRVFGMEFKDYNDFVKKHGLLTSETPVNIALTTVGIFYEGVNVLLRRKLVDIDLVTDLFSESVKMVWKKMKPIAEGTRKQLDYQQLFEWFEYLYNEMRKREHRLQP